MNTQANGNNFGMTDGEYLEAVEHFIDMTDGEYLEAVEHFIDYKIWFPKAEVMARKSQEASSFQGYFHYNDAEVRRTLIHAFHNRATSAVVNGMLTPTMIEKLRGDNYDVTFNQGEGWSSTTISWEALVRKALSAAVEPAPVAQKPQSFFSAMMATFPSANELKAGLRQEEVDTAYEVVKILRKLEALQRCDEKLVAVGYLSEDAKKMLIEKGYVVEPGSTPRNMCRVKA